MASIEPTMFSHETLFRGRQIFENRAHRRIILCGLGALGSNLADLLASQGYLRLAGLDKDRVERSNLGTQAYSPADVGKKKATQTAANIFRRLQVIIERFDVELSSKNASVLASYDLVVDLFDNSASRNLVYLFCREHKVPCLHTGMSGDGFIEIQWNERYRLHPEIEAGDGPCEYPLATNLVHIATALTAEIINTFIDHGVRRSIEFTLKDLHIDAQVVK